MLSVVVTIVDGGERLARCLSALRRQQDAPELEIIVPYDDSVTGIEVLRQDFPEVRFLPLGTLSTVRPAHTPGGQHELFDMRRSAGLAAAHGELVAMLEDRGAPRSDWARAAARSQDSAEAAVGGAIENVNRALLNRAVYLCDFGRYQLPFPRHTAAYVSDTNICYKRRAIEATRGVWQHRYHETTVHWALQESGEALLLSPEMVVEQDRGRLKLRELLRERVQFGRLFAYTRAREQGLPKRLALAAATPLLPGLLLGRLAKRQLQTTSFGQFARVAPALLVLLAAWSAGEAAGYITGRA